MTIDESKIKELMDKISNSPEEEVELPDEFLNELDQEQIILIYVEKMIADKGVEPTDELRNKLRSELSEEITKNIVLAMPDYLVNQINDDVDDETMNRLIDESGIDVETITEQTMTAFREKYLEEEK